MVLLVLEDVTVPPRSGVRDEDGTTSGSGGIKGGIWYEGGRVLPVLPKLPWTADNGGDINSSDLSRRSSLEPETARD